MAAWVLHVDLDQFIAAVEVLRHPELRGCPVVVGGDGDPAKRGVVSTASYEARAFGVHSGQPLRRAARLCPDAVFLPVDREAYEAVSAEVMAALRASGAIVQVVGWDEAFLAVDTDDPEGFARGLQRRVKQATELDCTVGIGENKLQAKLATGFGKPAGVFRLTDQNWFTVLGDRPTDALWGIGAKTAQKLAGRGVRTVRELAAADPDELALVFGPATGPWLVLLARGHGERTVDDTPYRARSHGREVTYQQDIDDWDEVTAEVARLADVVAAELAEAEEQRPAVRVVAKVRYAPFFTETHGQKLAAPTMAAEPIRAAALGALALFSQRKPVRLLGVRVEFASLSSCVRTVMRRQVFTWRSLARYFSLVTAPGRTTKDINMTISRTGQRLLRAAVACGVGLFSVAGVAVPASIASAAPAHPAAPAKTVTISSTGLKSGAIKHVWLIILENKSYDATFTGLNQNSYLWKTLPQQGVLLKNYYGTGHSSMDNYLSLVSGQSPNEDTQEDCSVANKTIGPNSDIESKGGFFRNKNFGQMYSPANATQPSGANAPLGSNGCTYPTDVPTLFNQLNAAHETWKGYAQDIGGAQTPGSTTYQANTVPNREAAACAGPGTPANNPDTNPTNMASGFPSGVTTLTAAQPNDQYVAKHFPFPWFQSLTGSTVNGAALNEPSNGGTNCDANHVTNLDNPTTGLVHDLKNAKDTPAFSWITPDNCSDAHDAVCHGNNLSGAFNSNGTPNYNSPQPYVPETTTPKNYTGGLYASDLFLKYYIPLIEQSQAFKQGGLIDVTFDEAFPPFTYTGNSFNDANNYPPTKKDQPNAAESIKTDTAGENLFGRNVNYEPTGPNSTLGTNSKGDQLYPGPGNNAFIDRPPACTSTSPTLVPADCVPGIVRGGAGSPPAARTDTVTGSSSSSDITDTSIVSDDTGRAVTGTNIPANSYVGAVLNTGPLFPTTNTGSATTGSFQLVGQDGTPVTPTGAVTSIKLSAEGDPGDLTAGETPDPLWDATDPTTGGGDTGSVLISPFIKPGTVSTVYYNHYSWLRTMEDIFNVKAGHDHTKLPAGTVSGGLDGQGHLGYAAQLGLRSFGRDVFNQPSGYGCGCNNKLTALTVPGTGSSSGPAGPWLGLAIGAPLAALLVTGGYLWTRRRGFALGRS